MESLMCMSCLPKKLKRPNLPIYCLLQGKSEKKLKQLQKTLAELETSTDGERRNREMAEEDREALTTTLRAEQTRSLSLKEQVESLQVYYSFTLYHSAQQCQYCQPRLTEQVFSSDVFFVFFDVLSFLQACNSSNDASRWPPILIWSASWSCTALELESVLLQILAMFAGAADCCQQETWRWRQASWLQVKAGGTGDDITKVYLFLYDAE